MSRGAYHHARAKDRRQRKRCLIAREAARLISEHGIQDFHHAKHKAAQRLGFDRQLLPHNREIDQALREHQRMFRADTQPHALRERRAAACQAMRFFARFRPYLTGAVLNGTADQHSTVQLHLFCDTVEEFVRFLHEHNVPARQRSRRLHLAGHGETECPCFLTTCDRIAFDMVVLPSRYLHRPILDSLRNEPAQRANLAAVEALMEALDGECLPTRNDPYGNSLVPAWPGTQTPRGKAGRRTLP